MGDLMGLCGAGIVMRGCGCAVDSGLYGVTISAGGAGKMGGNGNGWATGIKGVVTGVQGGGGGISIWAAVTACGSGIKGVVAGVHGGGGGISIWAAVTACGSACMRGAGVGGFCQEFGYTQPRGCVIWRDCCGLIAPKAP